MRPIRVIGTLVFALLAVACDEGQQDPFGKIGCSAASYSAASGYGTSIGTSLGDTYYTQKMNEEVTIQRFFFDGVPAAVWILNEGSPQQRNAYATPDGHILFGYHMFYYVVQNYSELAAAGVLAHEWGHQTQFRFGWSRQNPLMELEADAFSGFYMALAKQWAWSQIQGYFANVYATGDYNFHHPSHHGTPDQRLAAAYLGVNAAIEAIEQDRAYSYEELHQLFVGEITGRILQTGTAASGVVAQTPAAGERVEAARDRLEKIDLESIATGRSKGAEVTYPRKLTSSELEDLRLYIDRPSSR